MKYARRTILSLFAFCAACGGESSSAPSPAPAPKPAAPVVSPMAEKEAQEKFQSLCSTCHGTTGKGDGPGAAAINPKPRSFNDVAWQDSVTDEHIQKVITLGGAAVGKSPFMPPSPDLKGKTDVLNGLTKIVRSFKGK